MAGWHLETDTFGSISVHTQALLLQGGFLPGSSSVLCYVPDDGSLFFYMQVVSYVRGLESSDSCTFSYSTDGQDTWTTLSELTNGDDVPSCINYDGLAARDSVQSEGQGLWLRLTLRHTSYWDFCFLESADSHPTDTTATTSTTTTTSTLDYSLQFQIYSTTFLCADTMDHWEIDDPEASHLNGNMCLSPNGTAIQNLTIDLDLYESLEIYGVLMSNLLGLEDMCVFEVSFDAEGVVWEFPIMVLVKGQDTGTQFGDIGTFDPLNSVWNKTVILRLRSLSYSLDSMCCLHATGVSGQHKLE